MTMVASDSNCEYNILADRILRPDAYDCHASKTISSEPLEEESISFSLPHNTSTDRPRPTEPIEPTQSIVSISDNALEYGSTSIN